jgi:hypothetical protein
MIAFDGKQLSRADPAGDRFPRPAAARRAIGLATLRSSGSRLVARGGALVLLPSTERPEDAGLA